MTKDEVKQILKETTLEEEVREFLLEIVENTATITQPFLNKMADILDLQADLYDLQASAYQEEITYYDEMEQSVKNNQHIAKEAFLLRVDETFNEKEVKVEVIMEEMKQEILSLARMGNHTPLSPQQTVAHA